LGYQHPWEHGHSDATHSTSKKLSPEEVTEAWQKFSERSTVPGEDDEDVCDCGTG
jgi:hypothetical protein